MLDSEHPEGPYISRVARECARLCSKDMMARIYEGKAAGYMAAQRVVTEIREMNEHE